MSVVVVGSVALDNVKTPFGEIKNSLGGSATFFAFAASYFTKVNMVAVIGKDFPKKHINKMKEMGIDLEGLKTEDGKTFRWAGLYHQNMNDRDTISVELNVFEHFHPEIPKKYQKNPYLFLANINPGLHLEVISKIKNPKLIVADTMNIWIENTKPELKKTLKKVDILLINDSEAQMLTETLNLIKAGKKILAMGPKNVIIKKGEHGAMLMSKNEIFSIPAYPLEKVLDPTGAGDCFAGGFMGYLDGRKVNFNNLKKAVVYGSIMASFSVEKFSAKGLYDLTKSAIQKRYNAYKKIASF
jgi:sugar/nucleoside kinase (ribokinase family)